MTSEAPAGLRIIDANPIYRLGEFERCLILDWWVGEPTASEFDRRNSELIALAERHPNACAYLEMNEPTAKPPSAELRKRGMEAFKKVGKNLNCVAVVVHGNELRAAFVRAVLTGLTFLVPRFQPLKIFKGIEPAGTWMQQHLHAEGDFAKRLLVAAEFLRPPAATAKTHS